MTTLKQKYIRKIKRMFDWPRLVEEAKNYPNGEGECGIYLGSVLTLSPSGKYYQSFANSNLSPCPICKGTGQSGTPETCKQCDGTTKRPIEQLAQARNETIKETIALINAGKIDVKNFDGKTFDCTWCGATGKVFDECRRCGGLGSYEAYQDQEWNDALDEVAHSYGGWIGNSPDDGCDIVFYLPCEEDETTRATN